MIRYEKRVLFILCIIMILTNGYLHNRGESVSLTIFVSSGIGASLLSIPVWCSIGVILSSIGLFFYKMIRPEEKEVLSIWQKAGLGLISGIIIKPIFNILW
jgi:hypothetical protein